MRKDPIQAKNIFQLTKNELFHLDKYLFDFISAWKNSSETIETTTSGSTGKPKIIHLNKSAIINSALATNKHFNLSENSIFFNCLPAKYIAGKMMIIRSLQANAKILFSNSYGNPIDELNQSVDFCAMTPHQVKVSLNTCPDNFKWIKTLIIGGGPIDGELEELLETIPSKCYHTFGMTETISHIAVREISKKNIPKVFICLPNVMIKTNNAKQLIIDAKHLIINQLVTNDIVEKIDNHSFIWKGRLDNVINSGGIKLHPEELEAKLNNTTSSSKFIFEKLNDKTLGEKLILIVENDCEITDFNLLFSDFNKYEIPKRIYQVANFVYTENNKINRKKTKEIAINSGKWYKPCL